MYIVMIGGKVKNRISLETTFKKLHKQLNPNGSPAISVLFIGFRKERINLIMQLQNKPPCLKNN